MTKFEHLTNLISKCDSHAPHMIVIKLAIHKIMEGEHKTRHTSSRVQNTWICSLATFNQLISTWFAN
jgi:hypothetical protein